MKLLELRNIKFGFTTTSLIFNGLSLSIEGNKVYAMMGGNGAGKTTLFNLITGFIKPNGGQIIFNDHDITSLRPHTIDHLGIGRTFQDMRLITKLTVKENIVLAMQHNPTDNLFRAMLPEMVYSKSTQALEKRAQEILEQFFLRDVVQSQAGEISYGQQKLLSLACCVANGAKLLLLDEAVAGIQPEYRNKITMLIKQLKAQGKTILLIEHNTDFIAEVADEIIFLDEGKVTTFENIEMLRKDNLVMEAYL